MQLRRHDPGNYGLYADWYGDPEIWHLTSWAKTPLGRSAVRRLFEERELSTTDDSFAIHVNGEEEPVGVISLMNLSEANESADLSVIGMVNHKTTGARLIPAAGKDVGDWVELGGLFGAAPVMPVGAAGNEKLMGRGGRIPAPLQSLTN